MNGFATMRMRSHKLGLVIGRGYGFVYNAANFADMTGLVAVVIGGTGACGKHLVSSLLQSTVSRSIQYATHATTHCMRRCKLVYTLISSFSYSWYLVFPILILKGVEGGAHPPPITFSQFNNFQENGYQTSILLDPPISRNIGCP